MVFQQAQEGEAYAALGITPTLEGELLTLTFQNGKSELWGLAGEEDQAVLPWVELLHFRGQVYMQLPGRES